MRGDANGKLGYYEIDCTDAACCRGSTVRLQYRTEVNTYLNLQYIGVEGTPAPAAPASKPEPTWIAMSNAKLSSDFSPSSNPLPYPAENCLEDRGTTPEELNANMCVSNSQPNPWWQASSADGRTYKITKVIVRNRADCLGTCRRVRCVRGGPISSARDTLTPSTHERAHVDQGCARTASGTSF